MRSSAMSKASRGSGANGRSRREIGLHARRDLPFAPDPREAFDMALLRMRSFAPQPPGESAGADSAADVPAPLPAPAPPAASTAAPPAASGAVGPASATGTAIAPLPSVPGGTTAAPERAGAIASASGDARAAALASVRGDSRAESRPRSGEVTAPSGEPSVAAPSVAAPGVTPDATPSAAPSAAPSTTSGASPGATSGGAAAADLSAEGWPRVIAAMGLSGMPRQLAAHCAFGAYEGDTLVLELEAGSEHMNSPRFAERLRAALVAHTGVELALDIRLVEGTAAAPLETPARLDAARQASALDEARRALDEDPLVQALVAGVDGSLDPSSVRPLDPSLDAARDPPVGRGVDAHTGENA